MSCHKNVQVHSDLNNCSVVGRYQLFEDDSLMVCDYSLIKDTIILPLSYFVKKFDIIPLDTCLEAMEKPDGEIVFSKNYIALSNWNSPIRLYERKTGKYLRKIGDIGQGPEEYFSPSCVQIKETDHEISAYSGQVKRYDLNGDFIGSIHLASNNTQRKTVYEICDTKEFLVIEIPNIPEQLLNIWKQTMEGEIISKLSSNRIKVKESPEPLCYINSQYTSVYVFNRTNLSDSLYQYNIKDHTFHPKFTINWNKEIPSHFLQELPGYYCCVFGDFMKWQNMILVDKSTKKGAFVKLQIDQLGNDVFWRDLFPSWKFSGGKGFACLIDPLILYEKLNCKSDGSKVIGGREMDSISLQDENSWAVIAEWKH